MVLLVFYLTQVRMKGLTTKVLKKTSINISHVGQQLVSGASFVFTSSGVVVCVVDFETFVVFRESDVVQSELCTDIQHNVQNVLVCTY